MQLYVCNLWYVAKKTESSDETTNPNNRISAYLKTKPKLANVLKRLQKAAKYIAIGFAVFELIVDILTSIPQTSQQATVGIQIAYFIIVLLLLFSTTISLLVFGSKLRRQLKVFKDIDNKRKKVIKKVIIMYITYIMLFP